MEDCSPAVLIAPRGCRGARIVSAYWSRMSGGELCEIVKCWSFLQSKSVNNICKLLQLLGDFVPRPSTGALLLDPTGEFRPQTQWAIAPQWKFLDAAIGQPSRRPPALGDEAKIVSLLIMNIDGDPESENTILDFTCLCCWWSVMSSSGNPDYRSWRRHSTSWLKLLRTFHTILFRTASANAESAAFADIKIASVNKLHLLTYIYLLYFFPVQEKYSVTHRKG